MDQLVDVQELQSLELNQQQFSEVDWMEYSATISDSGNYCTCDACGG
jgi:hypothetical protein